MKSQSRKINEILDREIAALTARLDENNHSLYQYYRFSQLKDHWQSKKNFLEHLKKLYNDDQLIYNPNLQDFVGIDIEQGLKKILQFEEIAHTGYFSSLYPDGTYRTINEVLALLFKELVEMLPNDHFFPSNVLGIVSHVSCWLNSPFQDIVYQNPHPSASEISDTVICCIHGTADRCNAFSTIINQLLHQWPESILAIHLLSFDDRFRGLGIENFAVQLQQKIKKIGSDTPQPKLDNF